MHMHNQHKYRFTIIKSSSSAITYIIVVLAMVGERNVGCEGERRGSLLTFGNDKHSIGILFYIGRMLS